MTANSFEANIKNIGEVGYVEQVFQSVVFVRGLPGARLEEEVIFETGQHGEVIALNENYAEIVLFSESSMPAGTRVSRTGQEIGINVSEEMLGTIKSDLLNDDTKQGEWRPLEHKSEGIRGRKLISDAFETGVSMVDLTVPLAIGQRELVIGDRKTGKTSFVLQALTNHVQKGNIGILVSIGKRSNDVTTTRSYLKKNNIDSKIIHFVSYGNDPAGLIYRIPYAAMAAAEYFRDKGKDVLLVLDDLTTHAKYYREISLEARRFPGRSAYPGDIFYTHARLLERAGKFENGSITLLGIGESIAGDLSGYIQTNMMAITDGHIFFDSEMYNQSRLPAINPYLSVTRVGEQAQKPLLRDASRTLSRFLIKYQRLQQLSHFGAEFDPKAQQELELGEQVFGMFKQEATEIVSAEMTLFLFACIWSGLCKGFTKERLKATFEKLKQLPLDQSLFDTSPNFSELVTKTQMYVQSKITL
jgi:F-type H+-transporting ATPase subunit alpha